MAIATPRHLGDNPQVARWLCDGNYTAVSAYIFGRHGMKVTPMRIAMWVLEYVNKPDEMPWLSDPDMWINNRLDFPYGGNPPDDDHTTAVLHQFPISYSLTPWKHDDTFKELLEMAGAGTQRSNVMRLLQAYEIDPVDRTAARVAGILRTVCPYCRRQFREASNLYRHITNHHSPKG